MEPLELMDRPRYMVGEFFSARTKLNKTHLSWYIPQSNVEYLNLPMKTFNF